MNHLLKEYVASLLQQTRCWERAVWPFPTAQPMCGIAAACHLETGGILDGAHAPGLGGWIHGTVTNGESVRRERKNIWWERSFSFEQSKFEARYITGSGAQCEVRTRWHKPEGHRCTGDQQSCDRKRHPRERDAQRTEPQGITCSRGSRGHEASKREGRRSRIVKAKGHEKF